MSGKRELLRHAVVETFYKTLKSGSVYCAVDCLKGLDLTLRLKSR